MSDERPPSGGTVCNVCDGKQSRQIAGPGISWLHGGLRSGQTAAVASDAAQASLSASARTSRTSNPITLDFAPTLSWTMPRKRDMILDSSSNTNAATGLARPSRLDRMRAFWAGFNHLLCMCSWRVLGPPWQHMPSIPSQAHGCSLTDWRMP